MTTIPSEVVAGFLVNEGFSDVYPGSVWPKQDTAILVSDQAGGSDEPTYGGSPSFRQAGVQVLVRGREVDPASARRVAHDIYGALKWQSPAGVVAIRPRGSGPNDLGQDENSRPIYSINFIVEIYE